MGIKESLKKKNWLNLQKRADMLPKEYLIVYKEIQKYLLSIDPIVLSHDLQPLNELVDLFEEGVSKGEDVLQLTGEDVAAFADGLINNENTFFDAWQKETSQSVAKEMKKQNRDSSRLNDH